VVGDLGDHGYFGAGPGKDRGVDPFHVRCHQGDEAIKRRGTRTFKGNDDGQNDLSKDTNDNGGDHRNAVLSPQVR